jgi:hypothetical protein
VNLEQIQARIEKLEEALAADDKKRIRLGIITHELDILKRELLKSNKQLEKEKADVDQLEKKNLKTLFNEILGNIEQQLEKERQEYLQVVLHHNSLIDEMESLEYEEAILLRQLNSDREQLQKELKRLLALKENQMKGNPRYQKKLQEYDSAVFNLLNKLRNIDEVLHESEALIKRMVTVTHNLKQVKRWGPYKMQGKGRYSSYNKKTYIDKANKEAVIVNIFIKKFDKELKDVYPDMDVNLSMEYFKNFLEHFYDNLITDWVIKRKLDNAIHTMANMIDKLKRIRMMLERDKEEVIIDLEKNRAAKLDYIKAYG